MQDQSELKRLLEIATIDLFHNQFERYFGIPSRLRAQFQADALLKDLRTAYLFEVYAESTDQVDQKIFYQYAALNTLLAINNESLVPAQLLYVCHYTAKIHYELGVIWMKMHQINAEDTNISLLLNPSQQAMSELQQDVIRKCSEKNLLGLAISAFEDASLSYIPFQNRYALLNEDAFCERTYALYPSFQVFDSYSPWARMISIACNHYLCVQEDEHSSLSNEQLIRNLIQRIGRQQERKGSLSLQAILEVQTLITLSSSQPEQSTQPAVKKRRSNKTADTTPLVIEDWQPIIINRDDFNLRLQEGRWRTPSFLRSRQQQDLQQIYSGLYDFDKPLVVTKPTGTGKTAEFSAIVNSAWENRVATVIVVPTIVLAEQTLAKLVEYRLETGMVYELSHIALFCPTKGKGFCQIGPITIVTQASLIRQIKAAEEKFPNADALQEYMITHQNAHLEKEVFFHPNFFSLLIVDEGHHVVGEKMYEFISTTPCRRPIILFSASTLPGEYPEIDAICQHVVTQALPEAIVNGELAPLQALTIDFSMYEQAKRLTKSIRQRMGRNIKELDAESRQEIANLMCEEAGFSLTALSVLKQVKDTVSSTKKMMVFTDSIDHANLLATLLTHLFKQNIQAFHTKAPNREAVLHAFKTNAVPVIVAVGALDEGFDDVNVNVILDFSIYVTRIRRIMQRLGRALRLREDGSGAILISIKLLPQDLQLIPRDVIMGTQAHGYLGATSQVILNDSILHLTLPEPIVISQSVESVTSQSCSISSSISSAISDRTIHPQSAAIVFPIGRARFKLGSPPNEDAIAEPMALMLPSSAAVLGMFGSQNASTSGRHAEFGHEITDQDLANFLVEFTEADYEDFWGGTQFS